MKHLPHRVLFALVPLFLVGVFALITIPSTAQDTGVPTSPADVCRPALDSLWSAATTACIGKPVGYICNGGGAPQAEPQGAVSNALAVTGALVEADEVDALRTPRIAAETGTAGIVWMRLPAPLSYTALLIGDLILRDVSPPDFPAWTAFAVATNEAQPTCTAAPLSALVLQTGFGAGTQIVVNGASISLSGTVVVHTDPINTTFIALSGASSVMTFGVEQLLFTGQQVSVPHDPADFGITAGAPTAPIPFEVDQLQNLPIALFERPVVLPQPGNVTTQGDVNMRGEPNIYAGVITLVPGGETLSVLGRSPDGAWFHVRRDNGETGWMAGDLLAQNLGTINAIYEATPLPPQRYGEFATRGRVVAPAGVNLRIGPDGTFDVVATLNDGAVVNILARSPYSQWVKVDAGGFIGWVALVALETQTYFEALPIDPSALPLPEPTVQPGLFGNAFPDPSNPENP